MADFILYDTSNIHRPSTSFHFSQSGSGYAADFDNAMFFQPSNPYNNAAASSASPIFRRRESTSLPASLSSTPTQPSFFAAYYGNNRPDSDFRASDSIDDAMTVPGLSPSPGVARSGSDDFGSNPAGIGSGMVLRNPFANGDDITPPSGRMEGVDDESKQYSLGRRMSEGEDYFDSSGDEAAFEHFTSEYLRLPTDPTSDYAPPSNFKNPKLERTISDVLEDELYSPNMSPVHSTASDDFLLDFADTLPHNSWTVKSLPVTRTASPSSFRDMSPFRKSSPYYPGPPPDSPLIHSQSHYNLFPLPSSNAMSSGNQQKFQRVQQASDNLRAMSSSPQPLPTQTKFVPIQQKSLQQQLQQLQLQKQQQQQQQHQHQLQHQQQQQQQQQLQSLSMHQQPQLMEQTTAKTISPKEALLDYVEGEEAISDPETSQVGTSGLFATTPSSSSSSTKFEDPSDLESGDELADFELFARPRPTSYPRSQGPYEIQNESIGTPTQSSSVTSPGGSDYDDSSPSNVASNAPSIASAHMGTSSGHDLNISSPSSRTPEGTDEPVIFVCPDCGKRFPKAQNLQLHRRTHSLTPPRKKVPLSAQTGPHRCTWINPATGKTCHKVFSRPYDLIRHQETIHASNRKTFKCELCGDDTKTFSRHDALARHIRVKHEKGK
ncbi:hypothetical protein V1509DRAFT_637003 [Lipomyces kononenkoae]